LSGRWSESAVENGKGLSPAVDEAICKDLFIFGRQEDCELIRRKGAVAEVTTNDLFEDPIRAYDVNITYYLEEHTPQLIIYLRLRSSLFILRHM
jgi:hypothetical protein